MRVAHNKLDLIDGRFGRLLVLEEAGRARSRSVLWKCRCDCGKELVVSADSLRTGNTKSCGCYQKDRASEASRLPKGEAAFNAVYCCYRCHARVLEIPFELSKDVFRKLITQDCFYCGSPPDECYHSNRHRNGKFKRNGLDRMDNTKGYSEDNVVPSCKKCNIMKKAMDVGEFLGHIADIARKHSLI